MPRKPFHLLLICAGFLLQCESRFQPFVIADQQNPCTIVADLGDHARPDPALQEKNLAFSPSGRAAIELRHYLARVLSLPEQAIAIKDDDQTVNGRIILLGKPGSRSAYSGAFRLIGKRWRNLPNPPVGSVRFDAWTEKNRQFLAITVRPGDDLLQAVYAYLDAQGVRWLFPGRWGESVEMRREIRVQQAGMLHSPGLALRGFIPSCNGSRSAAPDSSWLIWWARQRFTYLPLKWAADPQQLQRWGLRSVADSPAGLGTVWKPGFCASDDAALQALQQQLLDSRPAASLQLLDAAQAKPLCACARCQEIGNEADRWLHIVGRIGAEMARRKERGALQRDARLLAIQEPLLPESFAAADWPKEELLLAARMLPRCYNHSIDDATCLEANAKRLGGLRSWMAAHRFADLAIMEGYYAPEFAGMPLVLDEVITHDLAYYQKLGIAGIFCDAPSPFHPGVQTYQNYALSQAGSHGRLDADSLRQAFASVAYAGAATRTIEYLDMLEEAFAGISAWRYELPMRVLQLEKSGFEGGLLPLDNFHNHFTLYQQFPESDNGVAWERTFQLIHDARHVMDDMLVDNLPDQTLDRLLEAEMQLRFAELMVTFYDNIIRSLTLGADEPEMREEAAIRLRQVVKKMQEFEVKNGVCNAGTALDYSGLGPSALALLEKLQKRYGVPYERVYDE